MSNRDQWDAVWEVQAELEAAGVSIDAGQLEWAVKEVNQRVYERSLDRQYAEERARLQRQAENDEAVEWDAIEKRSRDAQRARG